MKPARRGSVLCCQGGDAYVALKSVLAGNNLLMRSQK